MPEIRTVYQELNTTNLNNVRDRFREPELFIGVIVSSTNNQIGGIARGLEHNLCGYEMTVRRDPVTLEDTYRIIGDNGNELIICSDAYYAENPRLSRIANVVIWDDMFAGPNPRETVRTGGAFAEGGYRRGTRADTWIIDDITWDYDEEWAIPPPTRLDGQFAKNIASMSIEYDQVYEEDLQESPELDAYLEDFLVIKT